MTGTIQSLSREMLGVFSRITKFLKNHGWDDESKPFNPSHGEREEWERLFDELHVLYLAIGFIRPCPTEQPYSSVEWRAVALLAAWRKVSERNAEHPAVIQHLLYLETEYNAQIRDSKVQASRDGINVAPLPDSIEEGVNAGLGAIINLCS
jgi:hypothetical protein